MGGWVLGSTHEGAGTRSSSLMLTSASARSAATSWSRMRSMSASLRCEVDALMPSVCEAKEASVEWWKGGELAERAGDARMEGRRVQA